MNAERKSWIAGYAAWAAAAFALGAIAGDAMGGFALLFFGALTVVFALMSLGYEMWGSWQQYKAEQTLAGVPSLKEKP